MEIGQSKLIQLSGNLITLLIFKIENYEQNEEALVLDYTLLL